jgi:hypothetical protein
MAPSRIKYFKSRDLALPGDLPSVLTDSLTAPAGGGCLSSGALARIEHLPGDCPTIVDGRIKPAQFDFLKSHGVELAVLGGGLFDADDLPRRAKGLAALASA